MLKLNYEGDFITAFANPERGYYKRVNITEDSNFSQYSDEGFTVMHSYIPVYKYYNLSKDKTWDENINKNLPEILLEGLRTGLAGIRNTGAKIILRIAYAWDWTPPVYEHWDIIKEHIAQIDLIISENSDIVMAMEAGVLGPWGEWHSDVIADTNSEKGAEFRYELYKYILDSTPDTIKVMLRTPSVIKEMLYLGVNPPEGQKAMTQAQLDRISYHDDSFMMNIEDWGSYDPHDVWWGIKSGLKSNSVTNDMQRGWVYDLRTSEGCNILTSGESEWYENETEAHEKSVKPLRVLTEMANLHTTEINADYHPNHIEIWKSVIAPASENFPAETVHERINKKLGYRLRLAEAEYMPEVSAENKFNLKVIIYNDGFAGIINKRPVYLVFDGADRYNILIENTDVRLWQSGKSIINISVNLPENIKNGEYNIALWLPDKSENLRSFPKYSVRFANLDSVWDKNGYNILGKIIVK
ncbi:hypothetical protein FACS1894105_07330 [Clostridia bacterium]|nr:hypothetical protein FACS1894105_07330 [Clostridia bacterium]